MSLAIAPTLERERQSPGRVLPPTITQKVQRRAYRVATYTEALYATGKLSDREKAAADKLYRHLMGAAGVDVRTGDGGSDLEAEESIVYHGQQVQHARRSVPLDPQWRAIVDTLEETRTLQDIGRQWMGCKGDARAYVAGLALLKISLAQLAIAWGFG